MKLLLLHFTAGRIGGVETILAEHAALFAEQGHEVEVVSGSDLLSDGAVKFSFVPLLAPDHPQARAAQQELADGQPGAAFAELEQLLQENFKDRCRAADVVFIHNVLSMPFHLAWTSALWSLAAEITGTRFVAWIHDLAARNVDYHFPHLDREPWRKLAAAHPRIEYVAVSDLRRREFLELTQTAPERCRVIPNGIDAIRFLGLTAPVAALATDCRLLERDLVLLHPARLLPRKNIAFGLRVVAALKERGLHCAYLVSGPPDIHRPEAENHALELRRQRAELGLTGEAIFLHELFAVTKPDLISLYAMSDALLFPSTQEGFGLPLLEASLHRLPIFCADLEPMNSLLPHRVTTFPPNLAPDRLAQILFDFARQDETLLARKHLVREFSWPAIYRRHLAPLLKN